MDLVNQVSLQFHKGVLQHLTSLALLQAIAANQVLSIPQSLKVLLLGQTQSDVEGDLGKLKLTDLTVLQHVVKNNRERERLLHEEMTLSAAIEDDKSPMAAIHAYSKISNDRMECLTQEAQKTASRRSGARGAKARKVALQLEEDLKQSEARYAMMV